MALNGSVTVDATPNSCDLLVFSWEATQDQKTNTSKIDWTMKLVASEEYGLIYGVYVEKDWVVTIDGQETTGTADINIDYGETKTLASGSTVVSHGTDGTKTFEFSFGLNLDITGWGSDDAYIGWARGSGSGELDTIVVKKFPILSYVNGLTMAMCTRRYKFSKRESSGYLTFASAEPFTIAVNNAKKNWNGTLYYSTDTTTWNEWDGTTVIASATHGSNQKIYMRGSGNSKITSSSSGWWVLTGDEISCNGNIENLLDFEVVARGEHPTMGVSCYIYMFDGCTSLTKAPELPATTLAENCYSRMFSGCINLTEAPKLPATTLANWCYNNMFRGCTSLKQAPALPATTLADYCYYGMFHGCTSLVAAPELPAMDLTFQCYREMFYGCTSLVVAPELPATTAFSVCYSNMFNGCTSLKVAPKLPATTVYNACYYQMFEGCTSLVTPPELPATTLTHTWSYGRMFYGCTSLTTAPKLPATTLTELCYERMFYGCTSLTQAPELPAITLAKSCYSGMFNGCTGLTKIPALPATTLAEDCYAGMFRGCTGIKLSETQTDEYLAEYRIPFVYTGTIANYSLNNMFVDTGGTFTGTPEINTTYYLHKDNAVVPEALNPNLAPMSKLSFYASTSTTSSGEQNGFEWVVHKKDATSGLRFEPNELTVGETYTISYLIQKKSGSLKTIRGHCQEGFSVIKWSIDGVQQNHAYNSNDATPNVADDDTIHYVVFTVIYIASGSQNGFFIQPNRMQSVPVEFAVWNFKVEHGETATPWIPAEEDM